MEKPEIKKIIGINIEYIRKQKNMTIPQFADYINVSSSQLLNVIKGERGFSISKLIEIADITGYPIQFILTGEKCELEDVLKEKLNLLEHKLEESNAIINTISSIIK